jgi:hypothetical protein
MAGAIAEQDGIAEGLVYKRLRCSLYARTDVAPFRVVKVLHHREVPARREPVPGSACRRAPSQRVESQWSSVSSFLTLQQPVARQVELDLGRQRATFGRAERDDLQSGLGPIGSRILERT